MWMRMKAHRAAYTLSILATLAVGILIGTVINQGVKGKEGQKSDAAPLTMASPQQMSNAFSQIAKQLEPSVVNINTESTVKNVHRRRGGQGGGDDEDGGSMEDFFNRFFGGPGGQAVLAGKVDLADRVGRTAAPFANARLDREWWSMPRASSLPTVTWWRKRIAFACAFRMILPEFSMTPR